MTDAPQTGTGALEAAIEAAAHAVHDRECPELPGACIPTPAGFMRWYQTAEAAVRAAAPLIEREALERAARAAARFDGETQAWMYREEIAAWLRERAKAVGE